jgi:hypothetical protein
VETAPIVAVVRVTARDTPADVRLVIYRFTVAQSLRGSVPAPAPALVEELLFPSDVPALAVGDERLVLLEPFPHYSLYQSHLGAGSSVRAAGGPAGIRPGGVTPLVRRYLEALQLPAERRGAARVAVLLDAAADRDLGDDGVRALDTTPDLGRLLSETAVARYGALLRDRQLPLERRRALLGIVRAQRLAALIPACRALLADPALAPQARQTLAALGETVSADAITTDLRSPDAETRLAALHATAALPAAARRDALAAAAHRDADPAVRTAAIALLGREGPEAIPHLTALLADRDQRICYHATDAIAGIGGDAAVRALAHQFEGDNYEAQVAAVFALRKIGSKPAMETLARVRRNPPDERLRRVIDLATGRLVDHE